MMMQEGEVEEEIGNEFDFGLLQDEQDVRAHSTRAEDFNFSELIYKQQHTKRAKQLNFSKLVFCNLTLHSTSGQADTVTSATPTNSKEHLFSILPRTHQTKAFLQRQVTVMKSEDKS